MESGVAVARKNIRLSAESDSQNPTMTGLCKEGTAE